jgi:hypothetical protein
MTFVEPLTKIDMLFSVEDHVEYLLLFKVTTLFLMSSPTKKPLTHAETGVEIEKAIDEAKTEEEVKICNTVGIDCVCT